MSRNEDRLLLGEWACLGALDAGPSHGFALAEQLTPSEPIGRVWSLSRPLTYRAIDRLVAEGLAEVVGEEPGRAGGNRTMIAITRAGRAALRTWLVTPVVHLRDLRSELLLKLVLCDRCGIDDAPLIAAQRAIVDEHERSNEKSDDVVDVWRRNMAAAAATFLDEIGSRRTT